MSEQRWLIQTDPYLAVAGSNFDRPAKTTISGLALDIGEVQVDMDAADLPHDRLVSGILASVGMPYEEISEKVFLTPATIKKHVHSLVSTADIAGRSGLARYFFEAGVFTYGEPDSVVLNIAPREQDVLKEISYGKTNEQIGEALNISPHTVKTYFTRMTNRTRWHGRERLAFAGLAGGYIGDFALRSAEVSAATNQLLLIGGQADEGARYETRGDASITRAAAHLLVS